jgi:hypothetical protein
VPEVYAIAVPNGVWLRAFFVLATDEWQLLIGGYRLQAVFHFARSNDNFRLDQSLAGTGE